MIIITDEKETKV